MQEEETLDNTQETKNTSEQETSTEETVEVSQEVENVLETAETNTNETTKEDSTNTRARRKTRIGKVVSDKMDKTITVLVERRLKHPKYGKYVKSTKKYTAHDEKEDCNEGDTVKIMETRPLSKRKRWRLIEIIERVK